MINLTDQEFHNFLKLRNLLSIDGIGPIRIIKLLKHFNTLDRIYSADRFEFENIDSINSNLTSRIIESRNNLQAFSNSLENEIAKLEKMNARVITYWDDKYPKILKNIYMPPLILYILGDFHESDKYNIAIVGTRKPTDYGRSITAKFSKELAEQNITIISGLARGVDSIAHRSAIKAGGRTIAVIGSGLDVVYPPENRALFNEITQNGVIISEFELGTKPDAQNFPRRNRIISGISLGTLVVESKKNGGAMQTANYAMDQNREVFAIPGNLNIPESEGTNILIQRDEAKLVTEPEDILLELNLKIQPLVGKNIPKPKIDLSLFEEKIYNCLETSPKHIDIIANETTISTSECLVNLLSLEFKGVIQQLPGKMFKII